MTYFEGFIAPVPETNRDAYKKHSSQFAPIVQEIGVKRMVENWDSDVPEGKVTDFRKSSTPSPRKRLSSPGSNILRGRPAMPRTRNS
jgi:uncharacterized protein YbaA (DUF1428 family)